MMTMLKKMPLIVATAILLGLPALTVGAVENVAYIDMSKVFEGYYRTMRSESILKEQEEAYKDRARQVAEEIEGIRKRRDEMQEKTLNVALSEEARQQSRTAATDADALYKERQQELRKFLGDKQKELRQQYMNSRDNIVKEITAFIRGFAEEKKYDLVMDISGMTNNMLPVVIYHSPKKEITDSILSKLNEGHEDELAKYREKPAAEK